MLTAPLEFGPLFCIAATPPVAQAGFALEPLRAETDWAPEGPTFVAVVAMDQDLWL